jgi:HlyD family secretion protein
VRKKAIAVLAIVALAGAGTYWYTARSRSAAATGQARYLQTAVRRGTVRASVTGTGAVKAVNGMDVQATQAGTVKEVLVQDGDRVKAGQTVLRLDNPSLLNSLRQAQLDLASAQANLDTLLSAQAIEAQEVKLASARLNLQKLEADQAGLTVTAPTGGLVTAVSVQPGDDVTANAVLLTLYDDSTPTLVVEIPQQAAARVEVGHPAQVTIQGIGEFKGTVRRVGGVATPASGNKDATVSLYVDLPPTPGIRPGMAGQATLEVPGLTYLVTGTGTVENDAVSIRTRTAGTVETVAVKPGDRVSAGALLVRLQNESLAVQVKEAANAVREAEQNLQVLQNPTADQSGQVFAARSKLEQARLTLESREREVSELEVKAPVDGQVSGLSLRIGQKVSANQTLFRVADYQAMEVTITVDELDIAKVRVGQSARITLDALPGREYRGKVVKVNPEGTFKNDIATFEVTVTIDNPQGLMAGMNASVEIVVEEKQNVLWLPAQAVQVRQGSAFVQVLENGKPVQKQIEIGLKTSQQVEVTGGLAEGDQVVLTTVQTGQNQNQNQNQPQGGPQGGLMFPGAGRFPGGNTGGNRTNGGRR